jgi:outer membrane protein assembly factor BamB
MATYCGIRTPGVRWRTTLEETGQSGVLIARGRVFFQSMEPLENSASPKDGANTVGWCADAKTGKLLWSVRLPGTEPSPYSYGFSDSSSPTPVSDGKRVWFVNASGRITCCDFFGKVIWSAAWEPSSGRPFNKQFEPILHRNTLLNLEPESKGGWNYLVGRDLRVGKKLWRSQDGLTHYGTPTLGRLGRKAVVLIGRGGHHDVPEKPTGLSLIEADTGRTLWRAELPGKAMYNLRFDQRHAHWLDEERGSLTVLDVQGGKVLKTYSLSESADVRRWSGGRYVLEANVSVKSLGFRVFPAWHSNILLGGYHWFLCFSQTGNEYGVGPCGPMHCVGRVEVATGKVEYLELPTAPGVFNTSVPSGTTNARGIEAASDLRSKRDGWFWNFNAPPQEFQGKLYWTLMNGVTYVLDGRAKALDERALLRVHDLGRLGDTWCLSQPGFDGRFLYYRTLSELLCLESD